MVICQVRYKILIQIRMLNNVNFPQESIYDLCIIGGGINGAGIAAQASHYGLRTFVCERYDFGGQTSSSSTKLIHGGLRYLENYDFKLVYSALKERKILQKMAPHIIWPVEFTLVNNPEIRNKHLVRLGLLFYDFLAGFKAYYNKTKKISLLSDSNLHSKKKVNTGFIYTDLVVDDARLVLLNILYANQHGATTLKNTECVSARFDNDLKLWEICLRDKNNNKMFSIKARCIVNSSGQMVNHVLAHILNYKQNYKTRLVKGSHIVIPKIFHDNRNYVVQNSDGRIIFIINYEDNFTLIGTTEVACSNQNTKNVPVIDITEMDYLLDIYNDYFEQQISIADIKWSYSGVRPLQDDPTKDISSNTRDYIIETYSVTTPLINIYGGKITTYRVLAKKVLDEVLMLLGKNRTQSADNCSEFILPGANIIPNSGETYTLNTADIGYNRDNHVYFIDNLIKDFPWLSLNLAQRFTRTYGSLSYKILTECQSLTEMGDNFGSDLHEFYQKEIDYLIKYEFADTIDDIIWRRTKMGLVLSEQQIHILQSYIASCIHR